jgi:DNA-binding transcriptional LysR family regulator
MRHLRFLQYFDAVARTGSIRKAAEQLNVTASAVNRRVMDLEDELETPLFERKPRGVRLTAAGELFVRYIREQMSDVELMKSQIEDLKGLRRGTISIACSQALALHFLPREIAKFRARFPLVHFVVHVADHDHAMAALAAYEVDLALVFRPSFMASFQPLMTLEQRLVAMMAADHPLAALSSVRLRDCAPYPVALPDRSIGGRQLLENIMARSNLRLNIVAESNSFEFLRSLVRHDKVISFQIEIGTPDSEGSALVVRRIDDRDVPRANLVLGQLRERNLSVPAAKFADQLVHVLSEMRSETPTIAERHTR